MKQERRILVIGCPGAGKSTFARTLQKKTGLPLYYLDMLFHRADKTTVTDEEFDEQLITILNKGAWIIDGNYLRTLSMRLEYADAVFFLDGIPACRFLRSYAPALSRIPVIASGPCVAHPEISEYARIIAYEPDFEEMGRASVRQLLEYKTPLQAVRNVREGLD